MSFIEILILCVALSLDAFATTIANYSAYEKSSLIFKIFAVTLIAGLHALFCFVGYSFSKLTDFISPKILELIVAGIFLYLSASSFVSFFNCKTKEEKSVSSFNGAGKKAFLIQSIITSLDAFIGGLTFGALKENGAILLVTLFLVTLIVSSLALVIGSMLKKGLKGKEKIVFSLIFLALFFSTIF